MIRKKYTVQKSFRLDQQLASDLELLADLLQRPQNELYHMALEELMKKNKEWFMTNVTYERFCSIYPTGEWSGTHTLIHTTDVKLECKFFNTDGIKIELSKSGEQPEERYYNTSQLDELKQFLRDCAQFENFDSEELKKYYEEIRFNYR